MIAPPKVGIEVAALAEFPGDDLVDMVAALGVQPVDDGELHFVVVGEQIERVEAYGAAEVVRRR